MGTGTSTPQVRSVDRALGLVGAFPVDGTPMSLPDLVTASGLPKTTVVRLLADLERHAFIVPTERQGFVLGPGFLRWVALAEQLWRVDEECRQIMRRLVDEVGETVTVYVRRQTRRVAIVQTAGRHTVRSLVPVGEPLALARGASGKLLLAHAPQVVPAAAAQAGVSDLERFEAELAQIRTQGYAVSVDEREIGAAAVAAPIVRDGRVVAALTMGGPSSRFTGDLMDLGVEATVRAAAEVSRVGLGPVEVIL